MKPNRKGFRGYQVARDTGGRSAPQHIQQLVMRDYCARNHLSYLLAATEYRMAGCTMVLDDILRNELAQIEGIVMYSYYLLPADATKRVELYARLEETGTVLHTAVEGVVIRNAVDAQKIEDCFLLASVQSGQQEADYTYFTQWDQQHAVH